MMINTLLLRFRIRLYICTRLLTEIVKIVQFVQLVSRFQSQHRSYKIVHQIVMGWFANVSTTYTVAAAGP
jgi:hypothetical protein